MSKILGMDYGSKRTGLAITDSLNIIASGLTTISTNNLICFFNEFLLKEEIKTLVIGLPKRLNNQEFFLEFFIQKFIKKFYRKYPSINIVRIDERFTSKLALDVMIQNKMKKKQRKNKNILNLISAIIILQSYLDKKSIYDSTYNNL